MTNKIITRTLETKLNDIYNASPLIILNGPKYSGKSTLIKNIINNKQTNISEINLMDFSMCFFAENNPKMFIDQFNSNLILKNIEYAPNLVNYISNAFAKNASNDIKIFFTSTNNIFRLDYIINSIPKNAKVFNIFQLSKREIYEQNNSLFIPNLSSLNAIAPSNSDTIFDNIYDDIITGNRCYMPLSEVSSYFISYINSLIFDGVNNLFIDMQYKMKFISLLNKLAQQVGQELQLSILAEELNIKYRLLCTWIKLLEDLKIIFLINPYKNCNSRTSNKPKIYFWDTGLLCFLNGIANPNQLKQHSNMSQIFKTYVISEMAKNYEYNDYKFSEHLYYYKDNNFKKIDLILNIDKVDYPIQITTSNNLDNSSYISFQTFKKNKNTIQKPSIISLTQKTINDNSNEIIIPISYI